MRKKSDGLYMPEQPRLVGHTPELGYIWQDENGAALTVPEQIIELAWLADLGLMRFYVLALPFPPSANRYWRRGKQGHLHRSDEADSYIAVVKTVCYQAGLNDPMRAQLMTLGWFWRDVASRDLNNCTKILYDALQGQAYVNDNQICDERHIRDYDGQRPRVLLFISETTAADNEKVKELEKAALKRALKAGA